MFKYVVSGAESSDAARKMLSLSNGARPSDSKRYNRPGSTQYCAPSPPQTPSLLSRSPSSVKSCPANTNYGNVIQCWWHTCKKLIQETCVSFLYQILMQILVQNTFTLHGIELRSILCNKLVQESMSDVQVSCKSRLVQVYWTCVMCINLFNVLS